MSYRSLSMISYGVMAKQDIFWNLMVLWIHEPLSSDQVDATGGNETVPASKSHWFSDSNNQMWTLKGPIAIEGTAFKGQWSQVPYK